MSRSKLNSSSENLKFSNANTLGKEERRKDSIDLEVQPFKIDEDPYI
jgi:hypothetical protein